MTKKYKISALVSTYKSAEFIAECLEDLENQTIADQIEIIVIDANSPENEDEIVAEFQKKYDNIVYVKTPERIGIYPAWNMAIKMARGEYLITTSTNDRLGKYTCEILSRELDADSNIALIYGDSYVTFKAHETFDEHTREKEMAWGKYSYQELLNNCMVGCHPMWRRKVHEDIGYFNEFYTAIADQDMWLRIGEKYELKHINFHTGLYWETEEALSKNLAIALSEIVDIRFKHQHKYFYYSLQKKLLAPDSNKINLLIDNFSKNSTITHFNIVIILKDHQDILNLKYSLHNLSHQLYKNFKVFIVLPISLNIDHYNFSDYNFNVEIIESLSIDKGMDQVYLQFNYFMQMYPTMFWTLLPSGTCIEHHTLLTLNAYANKFNNALMFYTDEDEYDLTQYDHYFQQQHQDIYGKYINPKLKTAFNLELLKSKNYLGHSVFYSGELLKQINYLNYIGVESLYSALHIEQNMGKNAICHVDNILLHSPSQASLFNLSQEQINQKTIEILHLYHQRQHQDIDICFGEVANSFEIIYKTNNQKPITIGLIIEDNNPPEKHQIFQQELFEKTKMVQNCKLLFISINDIHTYPLDYVLFLSSNLEIYDTHWLSKLLNYTFIKNTVIIGSYIYDSSQTVGLCSFGSFGINDDEYYQNIPLNSSHDLFDHMNLTQQVLSTCKIGSLIRADFFKHFYQTLSFTEMCIEAYKHNFNVIWAPKVRWICDNYSYRIELIRTHYYEYIAKNAYYNSKLSLTKPYTINADLLYKWDCQLNLGRKVFVGYSLYDIQTLDCFLNALYIDPTQYAIEFGLFSINASVNFLEILRGQPDYIILLEISSDIIECLQRVKFLMPSIKIYFAINKITQNVNLQEYMNILDYIVFEDQSVISNEIQSLYKDKCLYSSFDSWKFLK